MKKYIDQKQKEMLEMLEYLVNIDSGSYNKVGIDKIGTYFCSKYIELGFDIVSIHENEFGNHMVVKHRDAVNPEIIIVAHLDTVFSKGTASKRPFTHDNNRAYGPGVIDMKGSLVTLYFAISALRFYEDFSLKNIQIIFNSDEEVGSPSSRKIIEKYAANKKYALIMEPSRANGKLVTSRRGGGKFTLKVTGIGAHSGIEPEKGASAIEELAHKITKLHQLSDYEKGINVNVGLIKGGTTLNTIAPHAEAQIEIRVNTLKQAEELTNDIKDICTAPDVEGTELELKGGLTRPPMEKSAESIELANVIKKIASNIGLERIDGVATGGGSDAAFTSALGIPTIDGLGPVGGNAHSEDEYLEIKSLTERCLLLAKSIQELSRKS
ncbi:M20 family metallopeptidase [Evansella sp. AB-rgal1]|uniref:M20 family metallopeptidase n=1 Tax=Evansella sp. AB-rgal1 TaxID=3242696 RepID=UPI00359E7224